MKFEYSFESTEEICTVFISKKISVTCDTRTCSWISVLSFSAQKVSSTHPALIRRGLMIYMYRYTFTWTPYNSFILNYDIKRYIVIYGIEDPPNNCLVPVIRFWVH
jgi:hypothetical protein